MSVENPDNPTSITNDSKDLNGEQQPINGIRNGHIDSETNGIVNNKHKSSSKDKHRDKDRSDHKSSKSSHRDKDRHHSSSGKDKHRDKDREKGKEHEKSDRDKNRDKDKERDKNRDRDKDKDKDKHKSSSSSHHKSSKDKDRDRERHKEKPKENRDKDRDQRDKEKEHKDKENRDRDKDKDRVKEHRDKHKSSEKSKDQKDEKKPRDEKDRKKEHKSSSSHSKERSEKDRERNKERSDKDKEKSDKHRTSSSKDKHSSSSKSKHSTGSSSKDKHRTSDKKNKHESNSFNFENEIKKEIKAENGLNENEQGHVAFKELKVELEMLNPNDYNIKKEDGFNASQSSCDYSMSQFREDEPKFIIKQEAAYDNEDTMQSMNRDPLGLNNMDYDDEEEDIPLSKRKAQVAEDSDEDVPLIKRKKIKKEDKKAQKKKKRQIVEEEDDIKPNLKKTKQETKPVGVKNNSLSSGPSPVKGGRKKKNNEEEQEVWRWWEEEKLDDGVKWRFLEHKGPVFAPPYEPLPHNVKFYYEGKVMNLSQDAEEIACFYAKMLNHDYVTKQVFNDNFFKDWRKSMNSKEKGIINDIRKCNFNEMHQYFLSKSEQNKNRSKEEKLKLKLENEALIAEYGFCTIDGHKERIGNFKLEPPGLFRGRGEHPKMGLVKKRLMPEDVLINCSKDSKVPQPPKGHRWREVRHDNTVTWLASWQENVQGQVKYIMLNPSSKLKGEKDYLKYETARRLDQHIDKIRATYQAEWKSKEMRIRQRAVALYFIDKLALRAGNEKDEDQADTVGCCSLRVEHVALHKQLNGKENVVVFDFLGKDSIRYYNEVEVEKRVYKNLELFMENKKDGDELFDRLNTSILNEHLRDLMEGLTAKVFRTYNASITLQRQLDLLTEPNSAMPEKLLAYNRANRAVAVLCNHQRSIPKSHEKSMENLKEKIRLKREAIADCEVEYNDLKRIAKRGSGRDKLNADKKLKQLERLQEQLKKLELQETDRDENKTIALGTSKLNYLDPRISVAWCKKFGVPLEKIFNKTQREKFRWAIHMADEDYRF